MVGDIEVRVYNDGELVHEGTFEKFLQINEENGGKETRDYIESRCKEDLKKLGVATMNESSGKWLIVDVEGEDKLILG